MKLFDWLQDLTPAETDPQEPLLAPRLRSRLIELDKMQVKDVMIPRALVTALDAEVQLRRVRRLKSSKAAFFPVYRGDLDNILGWISKHKLLELLQGSAEDIRLTEHVEPVGRVTETMSVAKLADEFLKSASPFLIAQNDQGVMTGLVPLSEFVELVFGFELAPGTNPTGHSLGLLFSHEL